MRKPRPRHARRNMDFNREKGNEMTKRTVGLFIGAAALCVATALLIGFQQARAGREDADLTWEALEQMERICDAADEQGYEMTALGAERIFPLCYSDAEGNEIHYYEYTQIVIKGDDEAEDGARRGAASQRMASISLEMPGPCSMMKSWTRPRRRRAGNVWWETSPPHFTGKMNASTCGGPPRRAPSL